MVIHAGVVRVNRGAYATDPPPILQGELLVIPEGNGVCKAFLVTGVAIGIHDARGRAPCPKSEDEPRWIQGGFKG